MNLKEMLFGIKNYPLTTPKELEIQKISASLNRWTLADRGEILSGVLAKVLPQTHIHSNPKRKEAV